MASLSPTRLRVREAKKWRLTARSFADTPQRETAEPTQATALFGEEFLARKAERFDLVGLL